MEALKASVAKAQDSKSQQATTKELTGGKESAKTPLKKTVKAKQQAESKSDEVLAEQLANPNNRKKTSGRRKRTG